MRPVLAADGNIVYWLERIRHERGIAAGEFTRGQVGVSAAHQTLMREILKAAAADHPLILVGERGLGKELYARTVHENSVRASRPFVVVNAAAVTDKNAAALFFGCVRTRGRAERRGLMERAAGGTLFIKNIDLLPRAAQALLERVLETGSFEPAGADVPTAAAFRLMASAHKKPADLLAEGRLEAGLAALLAHRVLAVAPLRDRREDIAPLARNVRLRRFPCAGGRATRASCARCLRRPRCMRSQRRSQSTIWRPKSARAPRFFMTKPRLCR